jgi:hypothetical protein
VKAEGGRQLLAHRYTSYNVAGVKCAKDLFSRGVPKIGDHVKVILCRKNLLNTVEIAINGCI